MIYLSRVAGDIKEKQTHIHKLNKKHIHSNN